MSEQERQPTSLWTELKRRRVVRVAISYAAAAFVLLEAADIILPALLVPEWGVRLLVILALVGFPVAIALAWVFQLTPEGVRRERDDGGEGRLVARRRPVAIYVGAGALVSGLALIVAFWIAPGAASGSVASGADVIAVLPFNASGAEVRDLGEGMVDLLARNLDEVGAIRTVDPRTVLSRWSDRARGGLVDPEAALEIGREVEAGSILTGSVVAVGSEVRISADLTAIDGSSLASVEVDGSADSLLALVDGLSAQLLQEIWRTTGPIPELEVSSITTRNLEANRAFLSGEKHYRASEWGLAIADFQRAASADTGFALAYYRLARAMGWQNTDSPLRLTYANLAERFADRLPTRTRSLVVAERLSLEGHRAEAMDTLRSVVDRYPDDSEAWHRLADDRYHDRDESAGPVAPALEEQLALFERTLVLDPTFVPALIHPLEVAFRWGSDSLADRYATLIERAPGTHPLAGQIVRAGIDVLREPDDALNLITAYSLLLSSGDRRVDLRWQAAQAVLPSLARVAAGLSATDREVLLTWLRSRIGPERSGDEASRVALDQLIRLLIAGGRLTEAKALIEDPANRDRLPRGTQDQYRRQAVYAGLASPDRSDGPPEPEPDPIHRATMRLTAAISDSDPSAVRDGIASARAARVPDQGAWDVLIGAGEGFERALRGDAADGLEQVEAALRGAPMSTGGFTEPLWFHWLRLQAENEPTRSRAIGLLERPWVGQPVFDVLRLGVLARAYEAEGRPAAAGATYARFASVLAMADPDLPIRTRVEAANAAVARLDPGGGG